MKLSILIPTIQSRSILLKDLLTELNLQIKNAKTVFDVTIILCTEEGKTIGEKRNELLEYSNSDYVCFFDDDDMPGDNYIKTLMEGISTNPDCISLRGIITTNGTDPQIFEHSIKYDAYKTTDNAIKYERYPNHLNCIKAEIAKQFKFPEINHGEDTDWATQIYNSGLLKKEYYTEEILYHYKYISNK